MASGENESREKPDAQASRAEPPRDVAEALGRARDHGRAAAAEALAAVRALLDAAALATSGETSEAHRLLSPLASLLEGLSSELEAPGARSAPVLEALADALDAEIARWEIRAREDADARAVLRAFLGVRELLWELGVRRREQTQDESAGPSKRPRQGPRGRGPRRVQRVPVEG